MIDQLAREVIRDRTSRHDALQAPRHPRAAHALRTLADKLDSRA